ncbi:Long-chain-fatty-acid--CoA ligase [Flexistipes sinusarabici DSM 4947]|uniref:Long-chain-fatty-acid--CoA ligase n=1 Tax=Flexistipes sinusarabici (strain ATCC 49648 / DSM 4947 / MAS 10) TaxID=717231 RepID=F8E8W0_FLESM|nr:long-chain fatty acid--CoA ligase [Flexistipes sinusarabici]AEI14084.1 Long-chain-fatty-acid--CoA ligase [Flexistipes sinusarabici DSM 4947]
MYELRFKSIPEMLRENAKVYDKKIAITYKKAGQYISLSYSHFYERVLMCARGLLKLGIGKGEKVAILSENRAGWVIADLGILSVGAITVPVYATNTADQTAYVINHSGAKIVFVSNKIQYDKLLSVREKIPHVETVISFERFLGDKILPVYTLFQLSEISMPITEKEKTEIESGIDEVDKDDILTIIYTSGTTGVPKGVMLTHENIVYDAQYGIEKVKSLTNEETLLSFLPLSHALERTVGYYITLMNGCELAFAESIEKVPENMTEIRPTVMISVPRLFEKIYSRIFDNIHQMSVIKSKLVHRALDVGKEYVRRKYITKDLPESLKVKYRFYDKLVFRKIRQRFGGRMKFFVSGGAPLDKTINEFFWVIGIPILEGYGLTETSPAISINTLDDVKFGSVGTAFEYTEFKVAQDGELMVKSPAVMKGYFRDDEKTKEMFTEEGWLKTGDVAEIDEDGFIFIKDRKKEIIVTAGGKNIAPQPIENEMKLDKYISQVYVHGDNKPYLTALIVPNFERLFEFARENKLKFFDVGDLVKNEKVTELFRSRIEEINSNLPKYETIKKFSIVPRDFSVAGGELTPTLKLKRRIIYDKYREMIESMYLENGYQPDGYNNEKTEDKQ